VYAGSRDPGYIAPTGQRAIELDVIDEKTITDAMARIEIQTERLDILVNNAAIADGMGETLIGESVEEIDAVLDTNLRGPMLVTKFALPLLLRNPGGRVVNVSSGMGTLSEPMSGGAPAYRISKTGLNGLTAYLDGEFGSDGLIPNSVCPGWVETELGGENAPRSVAEGADTPVWLARFRPGSPRGLLWRDRTRVPW
jgi:NAD(P)-dependent dehydrogenase (short-subunit alcohol dehydrogenase family)